MKDKAIVYKEANFNNVEPVSIFKDSSYLPMHSNSHNNNRKRMSYGGEDFIQFNFQFYNNILKKITDDRNKDNTPYHPIKKKLSYSSKNMFLLHRPKRHSVIGNVTSHSRSSHHNNNKEHNERHKAMSNNTITEYANEHNGKGKCNNNNNRNVNDVVKYMMVAEKDGVCSSSNKHESAYYGETIKRNVNEGNVDTESSEKNKMKSKSNNHNKFILKKIICCLK